MKRVVLLFVITLLALTAAPFSALAVEKMDKDELKEMLGSPDLVLYDVRRGQDWDASEFKIEGAKRLAGEDVAAATQEVGKEKTLVFYCA